MTMTHDTNDNFPDVTALVWEEHRAAREVREAREKDPASMPDEVFDQFKDAKRAFVDCANGFMVSVVTGSPLFKCTRNTYEVAICWKNGPVVGSFGVGEKHVREMDRLMGSDREEERSPFNTALTW